MASLQKKIFLNKRIIINIKQDCTTDDPGAKCGPKSSNFMFSYLIFNSSSIYDRINFGLKIGFSKYFLVRQKNSDVHP